MKKTLSLLTSIAIAASASAHTVPMPHTHEASGPNWTTGIACIAALVFAVFVVKGLSRKSGKAK